uniref:G-protein coupled receptors family 3 profile domain-containing protein n=1 Tax=Xenopus tropicalis TaxID=8364 RepID=F7B4I5_XENTR
HWGNRALVFAVEEVNANPEILPNITLGYHIFDTCNTLRRAAQGTLWILSGGQEIIPNYYCAGGDPLAGVIGECGSTPSIIMAQILGLYRYPQISYFATNPILSDRSQFPSFFRTISSDDIQMRGLAQLISYFGWSWVGLLANDDDYGQSGLQMAKQEIINAGACVAFAENILIGKEDKNAPYLARVIKKSNAKVVLVIASDSDFLIVVTELLRQNVTGNIWVATEGWATSTLLSEEKFQRVLEGTIGFAIHGAQMQKFTEYLSNLLPSQSVNDPFIWEYWEKTFLCKWSYQGNLEWAGNATTRVCTGNETLDGALTTEDHRVSFNVYTSFYAIAWALHSLLYCRPGIDPFHQYNCANIRSFHPWHLLHYVQNVNFKTKDGSNMFFNAKGNPPAVYDIVNWRLGAKGRLEQVVVGRYDLTSPDQETLNVPLSKCSPSCPSGFRKVIVPGKPTCCYECARCPHGHISSQTDAVECHPCSWDTWPNLQQDRCLPRTREFLSYEEPLGYSLAAISILSSLIALVILGLFIQYKRTPIVRANNYSLSCLLLLSLFLCFLCSLGFIGYPQPEKCLLRQVAFGLVFALCISCVLAKTIIVVIAFKATKPGSRLRKWTRVRVSYWIIGFGVFIQSFLCVLWLLFSPPFPETDTDTKPGVIILNCNEGSPISFWCMLGYLGLLAAISFIVAFLARRLPDSFNEAKFIIFSMLAFLSVWVSFIPAYLSARGMYTVAMEVFAILSSTWAVLVCIFMPKCYIVLFLNKSVEQYFRLIKGHVGPSAL